MSLFESLLVLLFVAILLLQVSRRLSLPYPAMLAGAGVLLALVPGAPSVSLDPEMALALFIAPALLDSAYDFPVSEARRLWRPLFALAVVAVLITTGAVTWLAMDFAGIPLFAALALGAIVAPPDAAAASALLRTVSLPQRSVAVLKGESLLNDALSLLLFSIAVQMMDRGQLGSGGILRVAVAAPGGLLLGYALAQLYKRVSRFVSGTLGGNLLDFVMTFTAWVFAEHLGLSAVLCVVAFAMTIARASGLTQPPRVRVHTYALWETVVFLLNVLAFLFMGMQARNIIGVMSPDRLREALVFAGLVLACVIAVRMAWVLAYNRMAYHFAWFRGDFAPATLPQGVLVGWCGMRGLVTLATAFALPENFPQRDMIVLAAFAVVIGTLVVQGLTVAPLARLLGLDDARDVERELNPARAELAEAALETLGGAEGPEADHLRRGFSAARTAAQGEPESLETLRGLGLAAIQRQRVRLEEMLDRHEVGPDAYLILQEELDFKELAMRNEDERGIEEG